jgi:hypothetical protein
MVCDAPGCFEGGCVVAREEAAAQKKALTRPSLIASRSIESLFSRKGKVALSKATEPALDTT